MKSLIQRPAYLAAASLIVLAGLGAYALTKGGRSAGQNEATFEVSRPLTDGQVAPDFALERLNGETFRLSDHRGKVVALNFWATWCPPCREEIPDLIRLQDEMEGEVLFVGVSLDKGSPDSVRAFARDFGINYPIVIDDGRVLEKYGPIPGIPTTFFIGKEGHIRVVAAGMLTEEGLRPVLATLAEGKVPEDLKSPFHRLK